MSCFQRMCCMECFHLAAFYLCDDVKMTVLYTAVRGIYVVCYACTFL